MFKVIRSFTDLQDGSHRYVTGSEYPRAGLKPSAHRIKELLGSNNKQGTPLIEEVVENKADPDEVALEAPKRKRSAKK